ncbi:hypothetical protein H7X46_17125 [Pseudonocardia sp. C8]|uniref:hypothetical protein n=1 Tax=Pseudonocardia sp. C8 TaxID=2762759 RepID=UPI001642BD73|nr:hypothetical protein [Pseudonocardia sp. C8]MBC3192790.1 hypothetical protein [Pseudonocardia sp. C8]
MARDDPPYSPSGPGQDPPGGAGEGAGGDAVLAAIAHRLRARSERQQLLTERLRSGELRPGALADLAELAGAARRGARDGDHILVLAGAPRGPRLAAPPTPLGQALSTVVAASEAASRTVVPPVPGVSVDAAAEPVLGQILAELLAHAAGATPPGERLELHTRWGPDGGVVVELQCATTPRYQTPIDELDRALTTATPPGPVAPQEIGLHVAARLARAIGARLGVRAPAGNGGGTPIAVLHLPPSVVGGGQQPEQSAPAGAVPEPDPTTALRRTSTQPDDDGEAPWPPPQQHAPRPDAAPGGPPSAPPVYRPAADETARPDALTRRGSADALPQQGGPDALPQRGGPDALPQRGGPDALPQRGARDRRSGIAAATPFGAPAGPQGSDRRGPDSPGPGQHGVEPPGPGQGGTEQPGPGQAGPGHAGPGPQGPFRPAASAAPDGPPNGAPFPAGGRPDEAPPATRALPVPGRNGPPRDELFGPFDSEVPVPVDDADDPPIFAAVASAWFREPAAPETTALPASDGNQPQPENWRTPGDAEFEAARIRADRVVDLPTTAQGLPQRLPGQAMVPPSWRENQNGGARTSGSRERQPDRVRNRLASYQRGLREGRHRAAEDQSAEPVGGAVNGSSNGHAAGLNGEGGRNAG